MFDPDYGVYYYTEDKKRASVDHLVENPSLIYSPVSPVQSPGHDSYIVGLAEIYERNQASSLPPLASPPHTEGASDFEIELPANSTLIYPAKPSTEVFGIYGNPIPHVSAAELIIPAGFRGTIRTGFAVIGIEGNGYVKIFDRLYRIGSSELKHLLSGAVARTSFDRALQATVDIIESSSSIKVMLSVNPFSADALVETNVEVLQESGAPRLSVSHVLNSSTIPSDVSKILHEAANAETPSPVSTATAIASLL